MPQNCAVLKVFAGALFCHVASAQTTQAPASAPVDAIPQEIFSVASIKPSPPPDSPKRLNPGSVSYSPIRFTAVNMPLKPLILAAYGAQQQLLSGGPGWIDTDRYDIVATTDKESTKAEMKLMLRSLLADRFHLTVQSETRQTSVYALVVSTSGPKLGPNFHEVKEDDPRPTSPFSPTGPMHSRMNMAQLASFLTQTQDPDPAVGRLVIDETGLTGTYDITLTGKVGEWTEAVQSQLGLKLESRKTPVDYLVITHVERPSAN
jgi:uncharacterized protein (TIGR03435 family)